MLVLQIVNKLYIFVYNLCNICMMMGSAERLLSNAFVGREKSSLQSCDISQSRLFDVIIDAFELYLNVVSSETVNCYTYDLLLCVRSVFIFLVGRQR